MKAPDKLFLHDNKVARPSWHHGRVAVGDVEYIRKDALLEWAKERYKSTISNVGCYTGHSVWQEVIDKLNEM